MHGTIYLSAAEHARLAYVVFAVMQFFGIVTLMSVGLLPNT
jgi:hypothetical protein